MFEFLRSLFKSSEPAVPVVVPEPEDVKSGPKAVQLVEGLAGAVFDRETMQRARAVIDKFDSPHRVKHSEVRPTGVPAGFRVGRVFYVFDNKPVAHVRPGDVLRVERLPRRRQVTSPLTGTTWRSSVDGGAAFGVNGVLVGVDYSWESGDGDSFLVWCEGFFADGWPELKILYPTR